MNWTYNTSRVENKNMYSIVILKLNSSNIFISQPNLFQTFCQLLTILLSCNFVIYYVIWLSNKDLQYLVFNFSFLQHNIWIST